MMLRILVLGCLLAGSYALMVCPPNYCQQLRCAAVDQALCDGRVKANGGFCGCCDVCMKQLDEGDNCWQTFLFGVPPTAECGDGLTCNRETKLCERKAEVQKRQASAPCLARLAEFQKAQQNGLPLLGMQAPKCDANGFFAPVQCSGSVCYCADKNGRQLQNFQVNRANTANMDCQCARDQAEYMASGMVGKLFYCDTNGNYKQTAQLPTTTTTTAKPLVGSVGGVGPVAPAVTTVTGECATKKAQVLQQQQSSPLLGVPIPHCDADGHYAPRQCAGSECYCVRKDGTKIGDYSSPAWDADRITCQCARDKDTFTAMGLLGRTFNCRPSGNYQQYQCLGSGCYCTDDDGKRIGSGTVNIGDINNLTCP